MPAIPPKDTTNDSSAPIEYDLIVIGGGSGGLATSKSAASFGAKVALVDCVEPTPHGTSWGIGGTCANVGCIPKKLMHHACVVGKEVDHAKTYGWKDVEKKGHDWATLTQVVDERIKSNNWIYRVQLNEKGIKYYKAWASFVDKNTVKTVSADKKKTEILIRAPKIVVATGLRPKYPDIPGAEHGITSDDFFTWKNPPGKTLVAGASYVALELAGVLGDLGFETEVMIRSRPLKGFDNDCVEKVMEALVKHSVKIRYGDEAKRVDLQGEKKKVTFINKSGDETSDVYDTIIWAIGREPKLESVHLDKAGIKLAKSGKIIADESDRTNVDGIYALGDIVEGRPELTPPAIRAGQLLGARLFGCSFQLMDYTGVATTVFTPIELSTVGLTEEQANEEYGADNLEIYHGYFTPFEFIIPQDSDKEQCYTKVICKRNDPRTVLGIHFVGVNAAEVMQGFAVAFKKGITMEDIQSTVAIHPCSAEEICKLSITKRSGNDPKVQGCCG
ncbi:hypothetical protein WR25_09459 [Diploscapter pachys]|uniref:Thioredoxin-disulfide reductase n=1 Tax=Diploscapter pachys TaxID=2018661 RepID=A0A2A2LGX9_9BILA|nr:hypothetical protein WR25_09459 [Diploscapter pachys]